MRLKRKFLPLLLSPYLISACTIELYHAHCVGHVVQGNDVGGRWTMPVQAEFYETSDSMWAKLEAQRTGYRDTFEFEKKRLHIFQHHNPLRWYPVDKNIFGGDLKVWSDSVYVSVGFGTYSLDYYLRKD